MVVIIGWVFFMVKNEVFVRKGTLVIGVDVLLGLCRVRLRFMGRLLVLIRKIS